MVVELTTVSNLAAPGRRRRADAARSMAAILDAAVQVLGQRPDASMEDIAKAAGVSRQTVYAHYPSRDALLGALLDRATTQVVAAIDTADLDHGPAAAALTRFLRIGWDAFEGDPFLLHLTGPAPSPEQDRDRHEPIMGRLEALFRRGQASGEFDPALPVNWLLAATLALGHAAGEEVRAGRMTTEEAFTTLQHSLPRLLGTGTPTGAGGRAG